VIRAYVLIQAEVGKAGAVAAACAQIRGALKADAVVGPYDVIVLAEARNVDELGKLVIAQIQAIDGITRTVTCPCVTF
jgi:DNA-binding Lrp family transcriptional regulator